jgi:hypothetical protein
MKPEQKVVAVLSKEDRDPFKHFQPAVWKRPFYTIEDAFESFLQTSQLCVDRARTARLPKGLNALRLSYICLSVLLLLFVAVFVHNKMTFF